MFSVLLRLKMKCATISTSSLFLLLERLDLEVESSGVKSVNKRLSKTGRGVNTTIQLNIILEHGSSGLCEENTGYCLGLAYKFRLVLNRQITHRHRRCRRIVP